VEATLAKYLTQKTSKCLRLIWTSLFCILLSFPIFSNSISSEFYELEVTVTDAKTGEEIIGAHVNTDDMEFTGITDLDGKIILKNIGHLEIVHFTFLGYQKLSLPFKRIRELKGKIRMIEESKLFKEIVVYGRRDDAKEEIPYIIDQVTQKEIAFTNSQTAADVLGNSANVFIQKSQMGGGSPVIRGFEANKVLLVLDGVRMNNAIYREGHIQNSITVDNSILEQAEVIYGPGSLMYGSDALGGVVHFRTRDPKVLFTEEKPYELNTNASTRFATANMEKSFHLDFDYSTQNWGSITSVTFVDYDDLRAGANRPALYSDLGERPFYVSRLENVDQRRQNSDPNIQVGTAYSQLDFFQKIKYQPAEELFYVLNVQYSTSSDVPRYDNLTDTLSSAQDLKWAEWYYGPQNRFLSSLKIRNLRSKKLFDKSTTILSYQRIDEDRFKRKYYSSHRTFNKEDVHVFSYTMDFDKIVGKKEQGMVSYGIDLAHNLVYSQAGNANVRTGAINNKEYTRYPSDESSMTTAGGYLNYRWRNPDSTLTYQAGLRYSFIQLFAKYREDDLVSWPTSFVTDGITTRNDNLTWATGLTFNSKNGWQVHLLGASAFRSPNIDDFAKIRVKDGNILVPNLELKPEKAITGELTLGKTFGKNSAKGSGYTISATGFYTYLEDAIIRQYSTFMGDSVLLAEESFKQVQKNINAQNAYVLGGSGNLVFDFNKRWQFASSINYVKGRSVLDGEEEPLAHIPPLYGRTSLRFQTKKLRLEGVVRFNGEKPLSEYGPAGSSDNEEEAIVGVGTLGWTTYNFYSSLNLNSKTTLNFAVENILDTHYRPFSSGVSAAGRNFIVSLRGSF